MVESRQLQSAGDLLEGLKELDYESEAIASREDDIQAIAQVIEGINTISAQ